MKHVVMSLLLCVLVFGFFVTILGDEDKNAKPLQHTANMPVKEVTVFKDGHAFVLHEGEMPTDTSGNVIMNYLPTPVIGTFWPYSADPKAKLSSVIAAKRRVIVEQTALTLRELLEANIGTSVIITENNNVSYDATIISIPVRTSEEIEKNSPPFSDKSLTQKGEVILLGTKEGTKIVPINCIRDVTLKDNCKTTVNNEEFRNLLTLKLEWENGKPADKAKTGLIYLQKGIRWIPGYRITIDGEGNAEVELQATLINELVDLNDITTNLVVGVPTFAFQDTVDPIALQQTVAQLSPYFRRDSQSAYAFSNAMMTQAVRMSEGRGQDRSAAPDMGPEISETVQSEDLFIFAVKHVSLKKGARMVIPVAKYTLKYKDVYTLNIPFAPPPEVRQNFNNNQQAEIAKLLNAPKVMHKIRLTNESEYPLTTAPALIINNGRILAQGMMTYTSIGAKIDLEITAAVDIKVEKSDTETTRTPDALKWDNYNYIRVDLTGSVTITNYSQKAVDLEIVRHVMGNVDSATADGVIEKLNVFENDDYLPSSNAHPYWWGWYSWPYWWYHFNGVGRITWKFNLENGKSLKLDYKWHYFWRR
ncbi:MAG: hypothetical protein ABIH42_02160 [Planctomycetota bacterium]